MQEAFEALPFSGSSPVNSVVLPNVMRPKVPWSELSRRSRTAFIYGYGVDAAATFQVVGTALDVVPQVANICVVVLVKVKVDPLPIAILGATLLQLFIMVTWPANPVGHTILGVPETTPDKKKTELRY